MIGTLPISPRSPLGPPPWSGSDALGFRLGTLDSDPTAKAAVHFMVGSKAPWVEISDNLPEEGGGVPFGVRD
jgi:hypothetical protein